MIRKAPGLIVASIIALLLLMTSRDACAGFGCIFGTVKDTETKERIAGARMLLNTDTEVIQGFSWENGVYLIDAPNGDGYTLTIYARGYQPWVLKNITLRDNAQMFLDPKLKPLPPPPEPPPTVNDLPTRKNPDSSSAPYRLTRLARLETESAPANPQLAAPTIWIFPSRENQYIAQIEIKGSALDAIDELGVYDEDGELVPNVNIDVLTATSESIVIVYQLPDHLSADLVRSIQLRAGDKTFSFPMRHDFY